MELRLGDGFLDVVELSELIDEVVEPGWITDLSKLRNLQKMASDSQFQERFLEIKLKNKNFLSDMVRKKLGLQIDPEAIFDSQIKRLHGTRGSI